ncbi:MAG: FG-GAP repeat domain-containing protein [Nitrospinaceae bacterium]
MPFPKMFLPWETRARRILGFLFLIPGLALSACDFKLPSPPPNLLYKYNVLQVGQGPADLLTLDLNLDGEADIVSANAKNSTLTVLYGKGDGTFKAPLTLRVSAEPTSLAAGDLNQDGLPDLVVNGRGANVFTTLLGKEGDAFQKPRRHRTGRVPLEVIVEDFNNDGHMDLGVTLTFDKIEIYLGRGNGSFKKRNTYFTGSRSFSGVSGDFNGDGNKDIALAASSSQSSAIRIFWGKGNGSFTKPTRLAEGLVPLCLIGKDMNGDGIVDLVFASGKGDNLYMLYSNGDGTFQKKITFSGGGGPISLVAEHFNDDDWMDVAVANSRSSNFSLVMRRSNGLFRFPTRDYAVAGGTPLAITSGDYNSDGMMDIAVASNAQNTVEIYLRRRIFQ